MEMKVALLLANGKYSVIAEVVQIITTVLEELEIQIEIIDLSVLPYFNKVKTKEIESILQCLKVCKGVVAISSVPLVGIHGAMQSFFDHMSSFEEGMQGMPLLTITYSEGIGEVDAAHTINKGWSVLGGYTGGIVALNNSIDIRKLTTLLEKSVENFYRVVKQDRSPIISSERKLYLQSKNIKIDNHRSYNQIESFKEILEKASQRIVPSQSEEIEEQIQTGNDTKFAQGLEKSSSFKQLQNLPHYFIAQHEKEFNLSVQYVLLDTNEQAYIVIQNGDCEYYEGVIETPFLEITLTEDTLRQVMKRILTYQKAFLIGKIKVRGNFALVSKLDQIFKPL